MLGNQIFGVHEQALSVHVRRSEMIAHNLANVSTPHYQAKDIDFKEALQQASNTSSAFLNKTHENHMSLDKLSLNTTPLQYRSPLQRSLDGNTVDSHIEYASYAENTLRYLANITFMNHRLQALNLVLSGGK
jgi:flagellar basal-body rod protein FlgB